MFVSFSLFTSTLKLKTHSQLTQSPFPGTDCLLFTISQNIFKVLSLDNSLRFFINLNAKFRELFMSADLSVSWHYVVTLRRGRTHPRPREQLLLQNYKA